MMTLSQLAAEPPTLPTRTAWYLTDLGEARGKQELFTRQSPQKLKVLREHVLICLGRGPAAKWRKPLVGITHLIRYSIR